MLSRRVRVLLLLCFGVVCMLSLAASTRAGLSIRVVGPFEIQNQSSLLSNELGRLRFQSLDGQELLLSLDGRELEISNPSFSGVFHPVPGDVVATALAELDLPEAASLEAVVYCLPGLPVPQMKSFCVGREIFLAPSLAATPIDVGVATVVHELGHAFENQRMGSYHGPCWSQYRRLRGIDDASKFSVAGEHRSRPAEILAEDFRTLFGGPRANYSGTHENPSLPLAENVAGIRELLTRALVRSAPPNQSVRVSNHPNPFNPRTTIVVELSEHVHHRESLVRVSVVDVRGRFIRDFAALASSRRIEWHWDGTDGAGRRVSSGRYLLRARVGKDVATGSMLLIE